jgi:hypothetical protein
MVDDVRLNGDLAYASVELGNGTGEWGHLVVSLRDGRVLASSDAPLPNLLLAGPERWC